MLLADGLNSPEPLAKREREAGLNLNLARSNAGYSRGRPPPSSDLSERRAQEMIKHPRVAATLTKRRLVVLLVAAAVSAALAVVAYATPNSGVLINNVVARAGFADLTDIKFKVTTANGQEVAHVPNAQDTVMQQVVIAPGGYTGWHSHPGPVVVLVTKGTLTFYAEDDPTCTGRTYTAGQAFIDRGQGHVHIGRNEGSENLELWSAYFDVPPGQPFRIDAPAPGNCPF
jgi:quercetin dioxygenase-like cupin family protein